MAALGLTSRHQPGAAVDNDDNDYYGSAIWTSLRPTSLVVLASDLIPWAIEQTAALYKYFYEATDTTPPVIDGIQLPATNLTGIDGVPRYDWAPGIIALAHDGESGVDREAYRFGIQRYDFANDAWGPTQMAVDSGSSRVLSLSDGYYRVTAQAVNGAGDRSDIDTSPAAVFQIGDVAPKEIVLSPSPTSIGEHDGIRLEGSFDAADGLPCTVQIDWGHNETPTTLDLAAGTHHFSVDHQYLDDTPTGTSQDIFPIGVTVTNDAGSVSENTSITVKNADPVIVSLDTSAPGVGDVAEGEIVTVFGTFTDVGTLDSHTASIDWGDGTATQATIDEADGSGTIAGEHAYAAGGSYTVTVTLTDDDTGQDTQTADAVVTGVGVVDGVL